MRKKIFSVPLNPKLNQKDFLEFFEFLSNYKDLIYDVYFTSRIPPFTQDAMGDVFLNELVDSEKSIQNALMIQNGLGIEISATFNNIQVRPSQENLSLFIENFKPLYDQGIRSATIPHTSWIMTKQIQKEFPELFIKNTILRNVTQPKEVVKLGEAGFHYVNIDRDLMRDYDQLLKIKKAKEHVGVKIAILANEGCLGNCPIMDEHYHFNNTRTSGPQYFNDPISRISCSKWDYDDPSVVLKTANLTPWKEDWDDLLDNYGIDVIKMHGRESRNRIFETMDIIKRYSQNEKFLFNTFEKFIEETNLKDKPIDVWRNKIKTCKFECWDCHFCDKIYNNKYKEKPESKILMINDAFVESAYKKIDISAEGLTSEKVQSFLNIVAKNSKKYLEVGSYLGATACSVLKDNEIDCFLIDNWSETLFPLTNNKKNLTLENPRSDFEKNILKYKKNNKVFIYDSDMFLVDKSLIFDIDMFFYDGPHDYSSVKDAVKFYFECFAKTSVLIFDDANWKGVVDGAKDGILESNSAIIWDKIVNNDIESESEWWNGLYVAVIAR